MTGLDTNVLVHFLTQDDPVQGAIATRLMAELTSEAPGFVGREVLVELVWVLKRSYGYGRAEVAAVVGSKGCSRRPRSGTRGTTTRRGAAPLPRGRRGLR